MSKHSRSPSPSSPSRASAKRARTAYSDFVEADRTPYGTWLVYCTRENPIRDLVVGTMNYEEIARLVIDTCPGAYFGTVHHNRNLQARIAGNVRDRCLHLRWDCAPMEMYRKTMLAVGDLLCKTYPDEQILFVLTLKEVHSAFRKEDSSSPLVRLLQETAGADLFTILALFILNGSTFGSQHDWFALMWHSSLGHPKVALGLRILCHLRCALWDVVEGVSTPNFTSYCGEALRILSAGQDEELLVKLWKNPRTFSKEHAHLKESGRRHYYPSKFETPEIRAERCPTDPDAEEMDKMADLAKSAMANLAPKHAAMLNEAALLRAPILAKKDLDEVQKCLSDGFGKNFNIEVRGLHLHAYVRVTERFLNLRGVCACQDPDIHLRDCCSATRTLEIVDVFVESGHKRKGYFKRFLAAFETIARLQERRVFVEYILNKDLYRYLLEDRQYAKEGGDSNLVSPVATQ